MRESSYYDISITLPSSYRHSAGTTTHESVRCGPESDAFPEGLAYNSSTAPLPLWCAKYGSSYSRINYQYPVPHYIKADQINSILRRYVSCHVEFPGGIRQASYSNDTTQDAEFPQSVMQPSSHPFQTHHAPGLASVPRSHYQRPRSIMSVLPNVCIFLPRQDNGARLLR